MTRQRLLPAGVDLVQLYHAKHVLVDDIDLCRGLGWLPIEFDTARWADAEQLHDDVVRQLEPAAYYGRNMDALADAMADLADGSLAVSADATGLVLVFHHYDQLAASDRGRSVAILQIMIETAQRALQYGWPIACFVQSDDRQLSFEPLAPTLIAWNRAERNRLGRRD